MIIVTADVGGSKTAVALTKGSERIGDLTGSGNPVRPGRAMATGTAVAELARTVLARAGLLGADVIVVGAAGAGRPADADELRATLVRERVASRVIVVTDVELAFQALGRPVGLVLVAGTGSVVVGRRPDGQPLRRGGLGWQMGDEGGGYSIGRQALVAAGLAHDGRGSSTALTEAMLAAIAVTTVRDLVGWSTIATPREVAQLARAVVATAEAGDLVAGQIVDRAAGELAGLVNILASEFAGSTTVPVGLVGGLLATDGSLALKVRTSLRPPFAPVDAAVDPLVGGLRLATMSPLTAL